MCCTLKHLQGMRSRERKTPRTSAAIAAPTFRKSSIFMIVTNVSLSHPFHHDSAAAFTIVFETSIPEVTYRFPRCGIIFSVDTNVSLSLCSDICPGHGRLWPKRLWPIFQPTLANRGLDRLWPNRLWPILVI